ncbi:MAG: DUF4433 domain-containing protein, partial [Pedobacter sp.]
MVFSSFFLSNFCFGICRQVKLFGTGCNDCASYGRAEISAIMILPFHRGLKRWLIEAFSSQQTTPDQIARYLSKAMKRPCGKSEGEAFLRWLDNRDIKRLVHFTLLENVPKIMRYGLIPRDYLQLEVLQLALGAQFTDEHRYEELPHYNCLSITSPNYGMFYGKRRKQGGGWAVIDFDPSVLARLYFEFTPTNAAAADI